MAKEYDVLIRLMLLGDSGVGKTCLMWRFTDGDFHPSHICTLGIDFKMKTLDVDGVQVRAQIWDTAGQERYQTITRQHYRRAQGILLVYDVTSEVSFQHISKWACDMEECAPDQVKRILVGNKCDDESNRKVSTQQGNKLAQSYGMDFLETSAFTNHNVEQSFTSLIGQVLQDDLWMSNNDDFIASVSDDYNSVELQPDEGNKKLHRKCAC